MFATFCAGLREINSITLESLDTHGGQMLELYHEKISSFRPYIASLGALSIGVANWSKDFAYNTKVILPFLYTYFIVGSVPFQQERPKLIPLSSSFRLNCL